ncbi:hypothetical protein IFM89_032116, partial [Coptis chinensis]
RPHFSKTEKKETSTLSLSSNSTQIEDRDLLILKFLNGDFAKRDYSIVNQQWRRKSYLFWSPDCVENVVMGINGQYPGPTILAKAGDTIVVHLHNKLHTEGVVIHWHGIRQDGTYFYHGHYGMQRSARLYGSLIVDVADGEKEPFHYERELNMLLSDWWHQNVHGKEIGISSNPFRCIGEPQVFYVHSIF